MSPASLSTRQPLSVEPKRTAPRSGPVERTKPAATAKATAKSAATPESVEAAPDPVVDMLKAYQFDYELVQLDLSLIDRKQSALNQARISTPIDDDQALLYAEAMAKGDKFPPIVVYKNGSLYVVMDGNHRVRAADTADVATLAAYVVKDPAQAQVQAFTFEANTKHGLPTSLQDRIRQAIYLVSRQTHTAVQAAHQLGLPLNQLRSALDTYNAEKRFESLKVRKFGNLSATSRRRLDSIRSDVTLKAAAELVLDASISSDQLTGFVKEINSLRSEREQLALIERERERRQGLIKATAGGRMPVAQSIVTLTRVTSTINRMDPADLIKNLRAMTPEVRRDTARAASESVSRLMDVIRDIQQSDGRA